MFCSAVLLAATVMSRAPKRIYPPFGVDEVSIARPTFMGLVNEFKTLLIALTSASPCVGASGHIWLARDQLGELSIRMMTFGATAVPPDEPTKMSMSSALKGRGERVRPAPSSAASKIKIRLLMAFLPKS